MRTIIITICLLLLGITVQAQQALQKYYTATQALEGQADSEEKSKTRGKALAVFHDERVKEAGTETAKNEAGKLFRQYLDYDLYAALYPWGGNDPLKLGGKNKGTTDGIINFDTQTEIHTRNFFQALSPFLTGRRVSIPPSYPNWEDDEPDNTNSLPNFDHLDNSLDWLFFVNDPSNDGDQTFPFLSSKKWGYNDLERRKKDLCLFVNSNCSGSGTISNGTFELMKMIIFNPFPLASH